jgi:hypothetical protein
MEEFKYEEKKEGGNREAKIINIINGSVMLGMLLMCLTKDGGFAAFMVGVAMMLGNFVSMIIFIVRKNVFAFVSNIIWMLLMPVIGFGCCAMAFNGSSMHF